MPNFCLKASVMALLLAVVASSVQAQQVYQTHCNWISPEVLERDRVLAPWFAKLNEKIRTKPDFQQLQKDFLSDTTGLQVVTCFLQLTQDGNIAQLDVHSNVGAESLKKEAHELIRSVGPLPPNDLVFQNRVMIKLQKENASVIVSSTLIEPRIVKGRIGDVISP